MAYALQSMLRIRAMREDRAATELTAARREVSRAQERLSQRKRDLEEYEATKEARRDRIYEAVVGRAVSMEDLDLAREGVARIDEEGILVIYPAGLMSDDGTSTPIPAATYSFLKWIKADIYMAKTIGTYF
ncbi:MAG: YscO family type III secretion system apparatus protein, partial [Kiritimatiellae bacterium]|nr:YscO family type III secretion system apparatus protein [Kiritimatiellia bacterium]